MSRMTISNGIFEYMMLRGFMQRISGALRYEAALVVRIAIRFGSSSVCTSTSRYQTEQFLQALSVPDNGGLYCYTSQYNFRGLGFEQLVYQLQHQHLIVGQLDSTLWLGPDFKLVMVAGNLRFGPRLLKHALEDVQGSTLALRLCSVSPVRTASGSELPLDPRRIYLLAESLVSDSGVLVSESAFDRVLRALLVGASAEVCRPCTFCFAGLSRLIIRHHKTIHVYGS